MTTRYFGRFWAAAIASTLLTIGCDSSRVASPASVRSGGEPQALAQGATRTHSEFDISREQDVYLSCIDEVTHWVISSHVTVDVVQTPSGITSIIIKGHSNESEFYLVRANGVRYNMIGTGSTQRHDFEGPVTFVNFAEPKVFRSESGDILVTNYHLRIT